MKLNNIIYHLLDCILIDMVICNVTGKYELKLPCNREYLHTISLSEEEYKELEKYHGFLNKVRVSFENQEKILLLQKIINPVMVDLTGGVTPGRFELSDKPDYVDRLSLSSEEFNHLKEYKKSLLPGFLTGIKSAGEDVNK